MKLIKTCSSILAALFLMTTIAFAQTTESKTEVVIETVTIDKDGKEVKETIRLEGKDAEEYMKNHHGEMGDHHIDIRIDREGEEHSDDDVFIFKSNSDDIEIIRHGELHEEHGNVSVNIDDDNGEIKIKIHKDGMDPFIWEGEGEIPQDIKDRLKEEYDVDLDASHGGEGREIEKVIRIERNNSSNKARLGVTISSKSDQDGVIVDGVGDDSAAQKAGVKKGDVITHINGVATKNVEELVEAIGTFKVGDVVDIQLTRNGNIQKLKATLKENKVQHKMHWTTENEGVLKFDINDEDFHILMEEDTDGTKMIKKKKMIIIKEKKELKEKKQEKIQNLNTKPAVGNNILDLPEFNVYPNPSKGQISIDFTAKALPTTLSITDITGKEIYREEMYGFEGRYKKQINLAKAAKGAMLLTIQQGDKIFTEKLINQ